MEKLHIYFIPGLAASTDIFENIRLPNNLFEIHYLSWLVPESKNETIQNYAQRMCARIKHDNPILIGVSFGGIMVQEMSKLINTKKTIIISSIKSDKELPKRLKFVKFTKAYKLFPTQKIIKIEDFSKYAFLKVLKSRARLYQKYLAMKDPVYLPWAINTVLHWKQKEPLSEIIHIHGNKDIVFPIKKITNCNVIENGTHVMILNKAKQISKVLEEVI